MEPAPGNPSGDRAEYRAIAAAAGSQEHEALAVSARKVSPILRPSSSSSALLVGGGDSLYLRYWMRQSGLVDLLPSLRREAVYVGVSAGSMVMAPRIGEDFVRWTPPTGGDETLGMVDFSMFPHLDHPSLPDNSLANAEKWAAGIPVPAYAIDDQTAIKVIDGVVEVVSEGHWKRFVP